MGKFQAGNPGGPGGARPNAGRKPTGTWEDAQRLCMNISEEDYQDVLTKALEQAKKGDPTARAWLFDRRFGKVATPDLQASQEQLRAEMDTFKEAILTILDDADPEMRAQVLDQIQKKAEAKSVEA